MPAVTVNITSPTDESTFIQGQRIEVLGSATWTGDGDIPIHKMQLAAYESQFNGMAFTPWVHVNDFSPAFELDPAQDHAIIWRQVVIPFDGSARYMLTAFAFSPNRTVIGSSAPIHIQSTE